MSVVFRVAAGPRVGFGHLVRCRSLARALGVAPRVSIRGTAATRRRARALGWVVVTDRAVFGPPAPEVIVVDDPNPRAAAAWRRRARARGLAVVSVHDGGTHWARSADLVIDGSLSMRASRATPRHLVGPRFAVLDLRAIRRGGRSSAPRVFLALGGGSHVFSAVRGLARALARRTVRLELRVARGFTAGALPQIPGVTWVDTPDGVAHELAAADIAVVSGGLTLSEACAVGAPTVALAVVAAQRAAIRSAARAGAVVDGGGPRLDARAAARVAEAVVDLIGDPQSRARLSASARRLVDGGGAARVAAAVRRVLAARAVTEVRRAA